MCAPLVNAYHHPITGVFNAERLRTHKVWQQFIAIDDTMIQQFSTEIQSKLKKNNNRRFPKCKMFVQAKKWRRN